MLSTARGFTGRCVVIFVSVEACLLGVHVAKRFRRILVTLLVTCILGYKICIHTHPLLVVDEVSGEL